jgi:hypothetical protein
MVNKLCICRSKNFDIIEMHNATTKIIASISFDVLSAWNNFVTVEKILIKINTLQLQQNTYIPSSTEFSQTKTTVSLYEGLQTSLRASRAQLAQYLSGRIIIRIITSCN